MAFTNPRTLSSAQLSQFIPSSNRWTWRDALFSHPGYVEKTSTATIEQAHYDSLVVLFTNIVTPLDNAFPGLFAINSCYRGPLNGAPIGGGQHGIGEAIDISPRSRGQSGKAVFTYIVNNLSFDQLIWETNSNFGTAPNDGEPNWIHISHKTSGPQRKDVMYFSKDKNQRATFSPFGMSGNGVSKGQQGDGTGFNRNAAAEPAPGTTEDQNGNQLNFQASFEQIARNVANLEAADVDVTWGKKINPSEDSDWIGLKQFLLYLTSKFTPQSLFPFVELIPVVSVDAPQSPSIQDAEMPFSMLNGNVKAGSLPVDESSRSSDVWDELKIKNKNSANSKFGTPPSGYNKDRFSVGAQASNNASRNADLFALDPFQEGMGLLGELTPGGQSVKDQRNVGVRVYGQLVLSPEAIEGVPSKPGAIGFKTVEVQSGSTADNCLARITMTLVDVQGNKFTDINSPWSFIYDTRPGSIGGDFYFRYGWQIRVPDPSDFKDPTSYKFWNHPGWKIFDQGEPDNNGRTGGIKDRIREQVVPGKQVITLTQAINGSINNTEPDTAAPYNLFDEGISFDETDGIVKVTRTALGDANYVRLSMLNPEVSMDENGAITATLNFTTTGSIILQAPLEYAASLRKTVMIAGPTLTLGDLLIAYQDDLNHFGFLNDPKDIQKKRSDAATAQSKQLQQSRNFDSYVLITGPGAGGIQGAGIHPDEIVIKIDKEHQDMLLTAQNETGVTSLRWFREVLAANNCALLSPATGSGAGINSAWIITTDLELGDRKPIVKVQRSSQSPSEEMIEKFRTEKDVFSYRFQGSLVTSLIVEKTQTPNAISIQVNNAVGGLDSYSSELGDKPSTPVTALDRQRNLKVIFSQLLNCKIECLAHPWINQGQRIFVKGMGFFDGEYQIMKVTHKLEGHRFTSNLEGTRILLQNDKDEKTNSAINGKNNFTEIVTKQFDIVPDTTLVAKPLVLGQNNNQTLSASSTSSPTNAATNKVLASNGALTNPGSHSFGLLLTRSKDKSNAALGYLKSQKSSEVVKITNACYCEMRKGGSVDPFWFGAGQDVKNLIDIVTDAVNIAAANNIPLFNSLKAEGALINQKYTTKTIVNGQSTIIVIGSP